VGKLTRGWSDLVFVESSLGVFGMSFWCESSVNSGWMNLLILMRPRTEYRLITPKKILLLICHVSFKQQLTISASHLAAPECM
jgi:hypothetical protein